MALTVVIDAHFYVAPPLLAYVVQSKDIQGNQGGLASLWQQIADLADFWQVPPLHETMHMQQLLLPARLPMASVSATTCNRHNKYLPWYGTNYQITTAVTCMPAPGICICHMSLIHAWRLG